MIIRRRAARPDEWEWLFQLHRATMREGFEILYEPWDDARQRSAFNNRDPRNHVEVIEVDGVAAGAIHSRTDPDGSLYIQLVEVLPSHQSKGVGTYVLSAAIGGAEQAGRDTTLETHKRNPAKRLYERLGFVVEGETETHLLMRRRPGPATDPRQAEVSNRPTTPHCGNSVVDQAANELVVDVDLVGLRSASGRVADDQMVADLRRQPWS